jgi:hypothetical protein
LYKYRSHIILDQIRVKRELFGRVSDIESIVRATMQQQAAKKAKEPSKKALGPDFKPEIGFLKEDAPFDIGVGQKTQSLRLSWLSKPPWKKNSRGRK